MKYCCRTIFKITEFQMPSQKLYWAVLGLLFIFSLSWVSCLDRPFPEAGVVLAFAVRELPPDGGQAVSN